MYLLSSLDFGLKSAVVLVVVLASLLTLVGKSKGGLVPKDFPCEGLVHRGRDLQRAEAERLGVKVELNVPPVPYCGLMNPEAFAMLKVCDQKDKGAPWEINHDK